MSFYLRKNNPSWCHRSIGITFKDAIFKCEAAYQYHMTLSLTPYKISRVKCQSFTIFYGGSITESTKSHVFHS